MKVKIQHPSEAGLKRELAAWNECRSREESTFPPLEPRKRASGPQSKQQEGKNKPASRSQCNLEQKTAERIQKAEGDPVKESTATDGLLAKLTKEESEETQMSQVRMRHQTLREPRGPAHTLLPGGPSPLTQQRHLRQTAQPQIHNLEPL